MASEQLKSGAWEYQRAMYCLRLLHSAPPGGAGELFVNTQQSVHTVRSVIMLMSEDDAL